MMGAIGEPGRPGPKVGPSDWGSRCRQFIERDELTGCWLWLRRTDKCGYGVFRAGGRRKNGGREICVHRASYEFHFGPIDNSICVLHHCDTPACCNPAHLFLGSRADNNRDRHRKGRTYGKLTTSQVAAIRGPGRASDLADQFGVNPSLVYAIRAGKKHTADLLTVPAPGELVEAQ